MKDLNDLRKKPQVTDGTVKMVSFALLVTLCGFILAYMTKDLRGMIMMISGMLVMALTLSNLRQRRINKCLLDEIDQLKDTFKSSEQSDKAEPQID